MINRTQQQLHITKTEIVGICDSIWRSTNSPSRVVFFFWLYDCKGEGALIFRGHRQISDCLEQCILYTHKESKSE